MCLFYDRVYHSCHTCMTMLLVHRYPSTYDYILLALAEWVLTSTHSNPSMPNSPPIASFLTFKNPQIWASVTPNLRHSQIIGVTSSDDSLCPSSSQAVSRLGTPPTHRRFTGSKPSIPYPRRTLILRSFLLWRLAKLLKTLDEVSLDNPRNICRVLCQITADFAQNHQILHLKITIDMIRSEHSPRPCVCSFFH